LVAQSGAAIGPNKSHGSSYRATTGLGIFSAANPFLLPVAEWLERLRCDHSKTVWEWDLNPMPATA